MDKYSSNIFSELSEERAIEILKTPVAQLGNKSERPIAASYLVNFPTNNAINTLIEVVRKNKTNIEANIEENIEDKITQAKAIETLGILKVNEALEVIANHLCDDDKYLVENAVTAIGEIGCNDIKILAQIADLLDKPGQSYCTIIQTLAKLNYKAALEKIREFCQSQDATIASAAMTTIYQFTGDATMLEGLVKFLQHPNGNIRRSVIKDLMDGRYYQAIPQIAQCPVSLVFRARGIRHLADLAFYSGNMVFSDLQPSIDRIIFDHPYDLKLIHGYDQKPGVERAISDLYHTDFGIGYLATQTIIKNYPKAGEDLAASYQQDGINNYGAHYHIVKLWGWLKYQPAYDLLIEALHNMQPQFLKSRTAAAIALGNLGDKRAIPELKSCLQLPLWELKYACLTTLEHLGDNSGKEICADDPDWLIQARVATIP
jgi:bilin biosynthesis protein